MLYPGYVHISEAFQIIATTYFTPETQRNSFL